jgi:hypothetical protein
MGRGKKVTKHKAARAPDILAPTPEQFVQADYERALLAYKRVVVIDRLCADGKLSPRQHAGLARYRDVAIAEDRSPIRDSLDKALHGRSEGVGLPPALLRTAIELGRLERALGCLRTIARAIAVDDMTLSLWAIHQSGSVMRTRSQGLKVVTWFEPRRKAAQIARLELRMAGERLAAEIGA